MRYYIYDSALDENFKNITSNILKSSRWRKIRRFKEADTADKSDISIRLVAGDHPKVLPNKQEYYDTGKPIKFSTTWQSPQSKPEIYINYDNWQGVPESGLNLDQYRNYVIEHEFGHALGYDHLECDSSTPGDQCPVMFQSTRGNKYKPTGFRPNDYDLQSKRLIPERYRKFIW